MSNNWKDGTDNWNTAADWSSGTVPSATDNVTIAQGDPQVSSNVGTINSLVDSAALDLVTGGVLDVATTLMNVGTLSVAAQNYSGGATLTVGGTLTNSATFNVGNGGNTSAPAVVNVGALTNTVGLATGTINLNGNNGSTPEAASIVSSSAAGFGTGTTLTGNVNLANDASIQFASGSITAIAGQSELTLNGAKTSILDAGQGANSALSGLANVIGSLFVENGNVLTTTGGLTNSGTIGVDDSNYAGGSSLTIGGTFTNASSTAAGTLTIGGGNLTSATTAAINGGLTNFVNAVTGTINVTGNASTPAVLDIASAAGFGTASTEVGSINLRGDAQIQFTGAGVGTSLTAIRGAVFLNGPEAAISSDGTATNSALTGLNLIGPAGSLSIEAGDSVTTTGSLTNQNFLGIDDNNYSGGSSLTLGTAGKLTNTGTLDVGDSNSTNPTTVNVGTGGLANFVGSTTGTINVAGSANDLSALDVNAAAGFGTAGQIIGRVNLLQDAQIQFASGSITTITGGSELTLNGTGASVLDKGGTANSALSSLTNVAGSISIENGPTVSTTATGGLTDTGFVGVDDYNYSGGSTLDVTNTLSNGGTFDVGNGNLTANATANVGGLTNAVGGTNGTINVSGGPTSQQTGLANEGLLSVGTAAGFGTAGQLIGNVNLYQDGQIQFTGGQIATIVSGSELTLNGQMASVGDNGGANNALTGLASIAGNAKLSIENGNVVATGGNLANAGFLGVDDFNYSGGSSLTIGGGTGTLTNTGTFDVGDGNLTAATTATLGGVANTGGTINVDGSAISTQTGLANEALLQLDGAAGFGNAGEIDGNVNLLQDGQIQFASGQITTIASGAELTLDGAATAIANDGSDTNDALTGLSTVVGDLTLRNGAAVATGTAAAVANTLTIGNLLTDTGFITTPNLVVAAAGTLDIGTGGGVSSAITFAGTSTGAATLALDATPTSGSTFGNTLTNFGDNDALDLKGLAFAPGATATYANGTLTVTSNGVSENFTLGNPGATTFYTHQDAGTGTLVTDSPMVCFASGTRIRTTRGDTAVEDLVVGDRAVVASGGSRPIRWIGHRTVRPAELPVPSDAWPVRILAGTFGHGLPERDLMLSPGHPVLVGADEDGEGGHLVPIMCFVNGTTIERVKAETVTYWHVELDAHDVLLAEGLPAESYLDWGDRSFFAEGGDHALANPDFVVPGLAGRCRPVALGGVVVETERRRLETLFAMRLAGASAWPSQDVEPLWM